MRVGLFNGAQTNALFNWAQSKIQMPTSATSFGKCKDCDGLFFISFTIKALNVILSSPNNVQRPRIERSFKK